MNKLTLTITEAADCLGIGRNSAYEAARNGDIPTIRVGKRILVPKIALEQLLESSARKAEPRQTTPA